MKCILNHLNLKINFFENSAHSFVAEVHPTSFSLAVSIEEIESIVWGRFVDKKKLGTTWEKEKKRYTIVIWKERLFKNVII